MTGLNARPTGSAPGPWQSAEVVGISPETATAKTFRLRLPHPSPHLAGQHYIVRLTAPDGYRAQRSYSVASAPGGDLIDLTVERLPDGEVSEFLHDEVMVGDALQVRGPVGYFGWDAISPVIGMAGGSGLVPLMAMLRTARLARQPGLLELIISVRTPDQLYYAAELPGPEVTVAYTRTAPPGFSRAAGRLSTADLAHVHVDRPAFVCGSPAFCDAATDLLLQAGASSSDIRVERFGPSG